MKQKNLQEKMHHPVLLSEVISVLSPKKGNSFLDLTAGYGGHTKEILNITLAPSKAVLIDRDPEAIKYLQQMFKADEIEMINDNFLNASMSLSQRGKKFDLILADLGVSSPHLNIASRGFAFSKSGPLDMRMDQRQELTAFEIVNHQSEQYLASIFKKYGEERKANTIAKAITRNRPIDSTEKLASIILKSYKTGWSKTHPATKVFQAIRIAVNNELELLEKALPIWIDLLEPGGKLAVISFHSIEDRIVKAFFQDRGGERYDADLVLLTKKPITASQNELVINPRARSAKLRAAAKIKIKGRG